MHASSPLRSLTAGVRRLFGFAGLAALMAFAAPPEPTRQPLRVVADLDVGESQEFTLAGGKTATVRLVRVRPERDTMSDAVRGGTEEAYAYAWEAYQNEYKPKIIAVARPHHFVKSGEKVVLDATKSWSAAGAISRCEWTFSDGGTARGVTVERAYQQPGSSSETLKVTDARGNVAYDFAAVQVIDADKLEQAPPVVHATYAPTLGLKPNQPITFKVRAYRTTHGGETWNFGDGSPPVTVKSDGNVKALAKDGYAVTTHRFAKPGTYIVSVERANERGEKGIARLAVEVGR